MRRFDNPLIYGKLFADGHLEELTQPLPLPMGDDAHGEEIEAAMDVVASLIADGEAVEAAEPGVGALDLPAVPTEAIARLDAAPGKARDDAAPAAVVAAAPVVIALVAMQLDGRRNLSPR